MSVTLETMKKDYKSDEDIINELIKTLEVFVNFDRTWNGKYDFVRCEDCNGPTLGHRAEQCRKNGERYEEEIVGRYETSMRRSVKIRNILNTYMDERRKQELDYKQEREKE